MSEIRVYDDFLPRSSWQKIRNAVLKNPDFHWSFSSGVADVTDEPELDDYYFINQCYYGTLIPIGKEYEYLVPLLEKINPHSVYRAKYNLHPRTAEKVCFGWHIDSVSPPKNLMTSVYYINSNDGETHLYENGEIVKIESIANRLVTFPARIKHRGTTATNTSVRCTANINYFEYDATPIEEVPNGI